MLRPQNKTNRRWLAGKSCDWSWKSCVIVRANLFAGRSMVMFKTQYPRLQITVGRKQVVHDRATSRTGPHHQSRMIVGWQVVRLVWRLTGRPSDWSCHLWNSFTTGSTIHYDQWRLVAWPYIGRATSRHLLIIHMKRTRSWNNIKQFCDPKCS